MLTTSRIKWEQNLTTGRSVVGDALEDLGEFVICLICVLLIHSQMCNLKPKIYQDLWGNV